MEQQRPLCPVCNERPVAINCRKNERTYYRKVCDSCSRAGRKLKPAAPMWYRMGYRKKAKCDRCGFRARTKKQMSVFHVDGNLSNVDEFNLKTICANCKVELYETRSGWKASPDIGDF